MHLKIQNNLQLETDEVGSEERRNEEKSERYI